MDDSGTNGAGCARPGRFITERELTRVLDDCLWQVERLRVESQPGPVAPAE